jgi:hypothetical protein
LYLGYHSPDPKTGKLQLNDEWSVMKGIFDEYGMQNYFYDKTPEGLARERNREIILQIQDLWYDEGARAWERHHVKGTTKEAQDLERADGSRGNIRTDIPWRMDIFALLALLRTLVTKKETEPSDTLVRRTWYHYSSTLTSLTVLLVCVSIVREARRRRWRLSSSRSLLVRSPWGKTKRSASPRISANSM